MLLSAAAQVLGVPRKHCRPGAPPRGNSAPEGVVERPATQPLPGAVALNHLKLKVEKGRMSIPNWLDF